MISANDLNLQGGRGALGLGLCSGRRHPTLGHRRAKRKSWLHFRPVPGVHAGTSSRITACGEGAATDLSSRASCGKGAAFRLRPQSADTPIELQSKHFIVRIPLTGALRTAKSNVILAALPPVAVSEVTSVWLHGERPPGRGPRPPVGSGRSSDQKRISSTSFKTLIKTVQSTDSSSGGAASGAAAGLWLRPAPASVASPNGGSGARS